MKGLLLLLALAGCVKPTPPVRADGTTAAVAALRTDPDAGLVAAPERLVTAMEEVFAERGLVARFVDDVPTTFADAPGTAYRLARLEGAGADLAVLVETETLYVSQLAGRYRWEVHVTVSVRDLEGDGAVAVEQFTVPVFLQFYREREEAAVGEATVTIVRHLREVLDDALVARQGR